ncbi:hypothetical protein QM012_002223 [Aureobasidium pullulans]|uniref:Uncharacterized protein n=1 Tax=Aureobasidium pullulans TaxID=5580 RepID=A0ABR0TBB2_AURPU
MKLSTVFAAAMALMMPAAVFGQNMGDVTTSVLVVEYVPAVSTSTVYQTTQFTIWSCPPDVTNCPLRSATSLAMVTAIVGMSTTICPVTFVSTRVSSYTTPASTSYASSSPGATVSSASVISTTYSTGSSTITIGSSTTSWSFWSTISYSATSTPSVVTSQATLYSVGPSLPTGVTVNWSSAGVSAAASSGFAGSGLASVSASASSGVPSASSISSASASVFNPAGASSLSAASNAASASAIVTASVAANGSSYTISYSPLGTGSLTSQVVSGPGSTNNISVPSALIGSSPLPTYTGMAGRKAVMTALSALAFGMVAALVLV